MAAFQVRTVSLNGLTPAPRALHLGAAGAPGKGVGHRSQKSQKPGGGGWSWWGGGEAGSVFPLFALGGIGTNRTAALISKSSSFSRLHTLLPGLANLGSDPNSWVAVCRSLQLIYKMGSHRQFPKIKATPLGPASLGGPTPRRLGRRAQARSLARASLQTLAPEPLQHLRCSRHLSALLLLFLPLSQRDG